MSYQAIPYIPHLTFLCQELIVGATDQG